MSVQYLYVDFETYSEVDLRKSTVHPYAVHPTTDVLCVGLALNDGPVKLVSAEVFADLYAKLKAKYKHALYVIAHNFTFEWNIWNYTMRRRYGILELPFANGLCTMVESYAMGLPGNLEQATAAVGIKEGKWQEGHRVMMQLCKPQRGKRWTTKTHPEKFQKLYKYCKQDVELERKLFKRLRRLPHAEWKLWQIDHNINERGVRINVKAAEKALKIADYEKLHLNKQMEELTNGEVTTCTANAAILNYLKRRGYPELTSVDKSHVEKILEDNPKPHIRELLELKQSASKSSTAKIKAMLESVGEDERVRYTLQYWGAINTGRWAGRKLQVHNFPRPKLSPEEIEEVFELLESDKSVEEIRDQLEMFYGGVLFALSNSLRGFIIPEDDKAMGGVDFSSIEARVTVWLADQMDMVKVFEQGKDAYVVEAAKLYNIKESEVDDDQRQIGKVELLSMGFGGGVGAFQALAKNYGVVVSDERADKIKLAYRAKNQNVVKTWYGVEKAAVQAVANPGKKFKCCGGRVSYHVSGSFLLCTLPSGRQLAYPYPQLKEVKIPKSDRRKLAVSSKELVNKKWVRSTQWYGKLFENIVQATARDALALCIMRAENEGYPLSLHVHDEMVAEVDKGLDAKWADELVADAIASVAWTKGLPVGSKGWVGKRYQK